MVVDIVVEVDDSAEIRRFVELKWSVIDSEDDSRSFLCAVVVVVVVVAVAVDAVFVVVIVASVEHDVEAVDNVDF